MSDINIRASTQKIFVDPASSSVSVINAGPPGPGLGIVGPGGIILPQYAEDLTEITVGNAWAMAASPRIQIQVAGDYIVLVGARYVSAVAAGTAVHVGGGKSSEANATVSGFANVAIGVQSISAPPVKKTFAVGEFAGIWTHGGAAGTKIGGRTLTLIAMM